jgi:hypothetical protein
LISPAQENDIIPPNLLSAATLGIARAAILWSRDHSLEHEPRILFFKGSRIFRSTVGVNEPMHILHVVGAGPNFMKAALVLRALQNRGVKQTLVHTGQHYDRNMSDVFLLQLDIPEPDVTTLTWVRPVMPSKLQR